METLRRINVGISTIILALCAVMFVVFGWSGSGWKTLAIPTGSMRPDIPPGSLVFVHSVPTSSLRVGDIITHMDANNPRITLSHRIVREYWTNRGKTEEFVTKGDANRLQDGPTSSAMVIGKVGWHVPYIGWLVLNAKKPLVILPIIYLAGLLVVIEETKRLKDYYRSMQPYLAYGFSPVLVLPTRSSRNTRLSAAVVLTVVMSTVLVGQAAYALRSNTVSLFGNRITTVLHHVCSGNVTNTNNINVTNINNQNTQSGNASSNNGTATSGNASSSSSQSSTVTITEGC
ncbi:MAG TPA: signal peptidase I [Candidatus Saccharimonadales bacterium]|nr:signal peptidase I [Candidatus Saccharimonadales bacterium]